MTNERQKKKVYIIGICGVATAPIAKMFLDLGWGVEGSDQGSFPPMSDYLKRNGIAFKTPYSEENLRGKVDLVVVGGNALLINSHNPEYLKARRLGSKIVSYPQVLKNYIVKKNSVVITGTYGKTTIAALVAWILEKAGYNPSFMIGGIALDFPDGVRKTDSDYSVIEGDEHPTLHYSEEPKFMYYKPKFALITAAQWDHLNVFKTERAFIKAFVDFVNLIPEDGALFVCLNGKNTRKLMKHARCKVITYALNSDADWEVKGVTYKPDYTYFEVVTHIRSSAEASSLSLRSPLIGEHNVQNVLGAVALTSSLGINSKIIKEAVESFGGIKRRLEIRDIVDGITVIDDLAHSPVKIRETLRALRVKYKNNKIYAVFDPHASSFKDRRSLLWYKGVFDTVDYVLVGKVALIKGSHPDTRVLGKDIVKAIRETQPHVQYIPKDDTIIRFLLNNLKASDVVIFMSSGSFRGIIEKTLKALNEKPFK